MTQATKPQRRPGILLQNRIKVPCSISLLLTEVDEFLTKNCYLNDNTSACIVISYTDSWFTMWIQLVSEYFIWERIWNKKNYLSIIYLYKAIKSLWLTHINYVTLPDVWLPSKLILKRNDLDLKPSEEIVKTEHFAVVFKRAADKCGARFPQSYAICVLGSSD